MTASAHPSPGFIAIHGNRTEWLLDSVTDWIARHPLDPLESEVILVQNNGMGEWIRMGIASRIGVCAATQFRLPARFQWWVYRQVIGRDQIPEHSPLDQDPLVWRLMRLLADLPDPEHDPDDAFAPLRAFLGTEDDEALRRHQLALRIADLFDQYQVHRPDWLEAWGDGAAVLIDGRQQRAPMPADQLWQPLLWQRVLAGLPPGQRGLTRSALHRRVIDRLAEIARTREPQDAPPLTTMLPRRVVVFGITHLPDATLELLAALSKLCQVMLAIPNPCRFHWADIIDGRELLQAARRRHPLRQDQDLSGIALEQMHLHAHPLLSAWGRQARDFVRQLDRHDDLQATLRRFDLKRVDLFTEDLPADASLLRQVQQHIADLRPMAEHDRAEVPPDDRSIVFHVAHSPVRELEILHDQLLLLLAEPAGPERSALRPRDIVVMVPDIDAFAPSIRAVFGQYGSQDKRHIPFDIADLSARGSSPLVGAIEWLMGIVGDRVQLPDLCSLLAVPAIAARLDLPAEGLETLTRWMEGAGIRWGLDQAHRADLALEACGDRFSVQFGLRRMLMGFAVGGASDPLASSAPFAGIDPYGEVGGLEAGAVGALAELVGILHRWRAQSRLETDPAGWAGRLRELLQSLLKPVDDVDRQTIAALEDALRHWLEQCALAGFDGRVPLSVAGKVWLDALERPQLGRRFRAGGVTFCTLTPMRAIPFEVVCLLGMNDRDFPRRSSASEFDLIAVPGLRRPGDRERRDDDRQLMLEALLSARRVLYLSWCGRSARDNSPQPPSVLVAQLRDYLSQGWSDSVVADRTTEHPLQPFSRRYFEGNSQLITLASEWRSAHERPIIDTSDTGIDRAQATVAQVGEPARLILSSSEHVVPLTIARLAGFLRNPVRAFFRDRLQVIFDQGVHALPERETFKVDALEHHGLVDELSGALVAALSARPPVSLADADVPALLDPLIARLDRSGSLPIGGPGEQVRAELRGEVERMIEAWCAAHMQHPYALERVALRHEHDGLVIEDWLDQRIAARAGDQSGLWIGFGATRLLQKTDGKPKLRADKLIEPWIRSLLAAASGIEDRGLLIGRDAEVRIAPISSDAARETLSDLLRCWREGQHEPLPVAPRTAIAFVDTEKDAEADADEKAARIYEGDDYGGVGEVEEPCLARCYPDYDSLTGSGRFKDLAARIYQPLSRWVEAQATAVRFGAGAATEAMAEEQA
jgi:exodeoxyribonuclease V gamma subunit